MNTKPFQEEMDVLVRQRAYFNDFVLPDYDTLNVKNVSSIIGSIYGVNSLARAKFLDGYLDDAGGVENVFFVVMDGLGLKRFLAHVNSHDGVLADLAQKGVLKPLTSTFPATTSTALTSIFTGLAPSEHNVIGYQMFSKEYGCVFSTLDMKPVFGYSSHVELARDFSRRIRPWLPEVQGHGVRGLVAP